MSPEIQTGEEPRGVPLRWIVMGGWVLVYLLMMWHGDWPWQAGSVWNYGSPGPVTLERSGAMVPIHASWERFLLSPWLHRSLLGLVMYLFFWSGTAKQMISIVGVARSWILFVVGGVAGAAAHLLSYPESTMALGAGPFDAIAVMIGASLCWGFRSRSVHGPRVRNGALVSIILISAFTWYMSHRAGHPEQIGKLIGLEAMLAAFGAGFLVMALFGPRRSVAPAGTAVRALAGGLGLLVLAAAVSQGSALIASKDRSDVGTMLARLHSAEFYAWELSRDQINASDAKRDDLARALERLLDAPYLDGYEGLDALRAYADALRLYTKPVPLPFVVEGTCRKTFGVWYATFEKPLREAQGLKPRTYERFYWGKP